MAIDYCVLASGSTGNALWLRGGGVQILIDCGLSAKELGRRLAEVGGSLADVSAVVCTHGHGDHVAGAAVLARRHHLDVYGTRTTLDWIPKEPPPERLHELPPEGTLSIGGLKVRTVRTLHDAPGSVALVISDDETSLGVVTDLGLATTNVLSALGKVDGLVMEMNHDEEMLLFGPYPAALKRRIRSELGHLSNGQGAELLARLAHRGLQHVTLAHLSQHNNLPEKALEAAEPALVRAGHAPALVAARPDRPGLPVALRPARQLGLPIW